MFYKQRGLWWSCSEFSSSLRRELRREILPAAEEADLAPSVASATARFAGELYGREQHLALGFLGRMLS